MIYKALEIYETWKVKKKLLLIIRNMIKYFVDHKGLPSFLSFLKEFY
jgi:hypothetical protein